MPRFVIHRHETPPDYPRPLHWDFMLEFGGALRTWALQREPAAGASVFGETLPDHRTAYLDYEGPISGNRGRVQRWDSGQYELTAEEGDQLILRLDGERLCCTVRIRRSRDNPDWWRFTFNPK